MSGYHPRLYLVFCALLALTCGVPHSNPAAAGTLLEEVRFDRADLVFTTIGEFDLVTLPSADFTKEIGAPLLPAQTIHILLPPASRLSGVKIVGLEREVLGKGYRIHPCQPPAPTDGSAPPDFVPPSSVYRSDVPYPAEEATLISENVFAGFRLASVKVYPLSYRPKSGELTLNRSIRLSVSYEPKLEAEPRKRVSLRAASEMERVIGALVRNPGMMDSYRDQALTTVDTSVARPLSLEVLPLSEDGDPLDEPGQLEYIIITTGDLANEFQPLADWKTKKGIPAMVVTLDWIQNNYPQGCDLQETIRNFLIEVKSHHQSLAYVLIGGDVDVVPVRFTAPQASVVSGYEDYPELRPIPTDLYYGDIDPPTNNWNGDGDAEFGESGDDPDAVPDLYVGRAPVNTADQAVTFVTKTLFWEREMPADHSERVLMLGGSSGYYELFPEDGQGAVNKEAIGADFVPPNILAYYLCGPESGSSWYGTWDCDGELNRQTAISQFNDGYLFVNHQDHSNEYEIGTGTVTGGGTMNRSDMDDLSNGPLYSVLFTLGCSAGAFDYDCSLEHFVRNPHGGGPMAIGNSRTGYWDQNAQDRVLVSALYVYGLNLGQAAALTKITAFNLYYRYIQNTLGDPELPFYTKSPGSLHLSHPASVTLGDKSITVSVTDEVTGLAVEGALVCAMKGLEDYAVGLTDAAGAVTFLFDTDEPGSISITATRPNYMPAESSIVAYAASAPFVYLYDWVFDDDTSGTSLGNGDHVVDVGERVEVPVTLRNSGTKTATDVRAKLSMVTASPYVTILDGGEDFGDISAGQIVTSPDDFDIAISPDCPPGHTVEMKVTISAGKLVKVKPIVATSEVLKRLNNPGSQIDEPIPNLELTVYQYYWYEYFTISVHGPDLRVVSHKVNDADGDGEVEAGEEVGLPVTLKNFGRGTAGGITGVISSASPYVTVLNDSVFFGDISYLEEAASATSFVFAASSQYDKSPLPFTVVFRDQYENQWTAQIEVSLAPAAPTGLDGVPGSEDILLTWSPLRDIAGYHVYRAGLPGGEYLRLNHEMIEGVSRFHDTGLSGATYYYYTVTSVNTSGRESDPSSVLPVQTILENQDGWPVTISGRVSSPLVLDIDGDGDLELLFGGGSGKVYAFNHKGEEVLDIDLNPTTISGFATAVGEVGTPSAADIDGDGLVEIVAVANSSTEHRVYAWRTFDGPDADAEADLVSGWPVSTPNERVGAVSVPALGDIDGDGDLEILVGGDYRFYAWHHDGTGVVNPDGLFLDAGSWLYGTAALADIDGNGTDDVVIGGGSDGMLYAVDGTATALPGWPVSLGVDDWLTSSPAVGDLDGDGVLEIVAVSMKGYVYVRRPDGSAFGPSWLAYNPQSESYAVCSSPSLSDLDGDGHLEIVVGSSDQRVYAWRWDGSPVAGWPTGLTGKTIHSSPALGDLNGDGLMEVVVANTGGLIYAWNVSAEVVPGWPMGIGGSGSSPVIVDLDQDGDVEVAVGSADGKMYVWDCDAPYDSEYVGWGQFHHDPARTGVHP